MKIVASQHYQAALAICPTGGKFLKPFYNNKIGLSYQAGFYSAVSRMFRFVSIHKSLMYLRMVKAPSATLWTQTALESAASTRE